MTLLYVNETNTGRPHITTCPLDKLERRAIGYSSSCGADWYSMSQVQRHQDSSSFGIVSCVFKQLDLSKIPEPQGHEIIEVYIDRRGTNYNYVEQ